jgi:single-stranded DNA-specific DHH superfamily exonuclease
MLTEKQIKEFREYLHKAENPLFFHDGDTDGLCSYLLLKKYIGKGKGVIAKVRFGITETFLRKVKENSPDYIFVLDLPIIDQEFIDKVNVPVIWLDHHPPVKRKGVHYYNPREGSNPDSKPTTYYAYKIAEEKDLLLGSIGCIADWHYPDFLDNLDKSFPGLLPKKRSGNPEDILFDSKLGDLIKIISFILKLSLTDIARCSSIISKIEDPFEIIDQTSPAGKYLNKKVEKIRKEYEWVFKQALKEKPKDGVLFVKHPHTNHSFVGDLSNELNYIAKGVLIVAREDDGRMKMSIRSHHIEISDIIADSIKGLDGYGGGHELACGASVSVKDFDEFLERFKKGVNKKENR